MVIGAPEKMATKFPTLPVLSASRFPKRHHIDTNSGK
jgi:hypothetical protein